MTMAILRKCVWMSLSRNVKQEVTTKPGAATMWRGSAGPSPRGSVSPCPAPSAAWRLASPATERRVKTVGCDETESKSLTPKKFFKTMKEVKQVPKCK